MPAKEKVSSKAKLNTPGLLLLLFQWRELLFLMLRSKDPMRTTHIYVFLVSNTLFKRSLMIII